MYEEYEKTDTDVNIDDLQAAQGSYNQDTNLDTQIYSSLGSKDNPYSISAYNKNLKVYLQKLNACFITGEVIKKSTFSNSSYLTLKDINDDSKT